MSTLTRYRVANKYNIALFALFLISMLVVMYYDIHLDQVNPFSFDPVAYEIADLSKADQEAYRNTLYNILIQFEYYAYAACGSIIMTLPILSCATVWNFAQEKKLFPYQYMRSLNQKRIVCNSIISNAFIKSAIFYAAYAIYLGIGVLITNMDTPDLDLVLWDGILGQGFGNAHMILYFLLVGLIQVFLFSFVFCIFSYSILLVTPKVQWGFLIPVIYYFAGNFVFLTTEQFTLEYLRPGFTTALTAYAEFPFWWSITPLVLPTVISIFLMIYSLKRDECIGV